MSLVLRFLHGCWVARLGNPLRGGERRSRQAPASALARTGRVIGLRNEHLARLSGCGHCATHEAAVDARGARARARCAARDLGCVGGSGREPPTHRSNSAHCGVHLVCPDAERYEAGSAVARFGRREEVCQAPGDTTVAARSNASRKREQVAASGASRSSPVDAANDRIDLLRLGRAASALLGPRE